MPLFVSLFVSPSCTRRLKLKLQLPLMKWKPTAKLAIAPPSRWMKGFNVVVSTFVALLRTSANTMNKQTRGSSR